MQVQQPLVGNGVDDAAVIACAAALGRHLEAAGGMVATAESYPLGDVGGRKVFIGQ